LWLVEIICREADVINYYESSVFEFALFRGEEAAGVLKSRSVR